MTLTYSVGVTFHPQQRHSWFWNPHTIPTNPHFPPHVHPFLQFAPVVHLQCYSYLVWITCMASTDTHWASLHWVKTFVQLVQCCLLWLAMALLDLFCSICLLDCLGFFFNWKCWDLSLVSCMEIIHTTTELIPRIDVIPLGSCGTWDSVPIIFLPGDVTWE